MGQKMLWLFNVERQFMYFLYNTIAIDFLSYLQRSFFCETLQCYICKTKEYLYHR